jgi:hypothetical protein
MNKRKSMSKTLRFEVFKRDSFSCQYCGATPSKKTMLEVDHIKPVAKGGDNDILNLITSCFDCNRGKSARELSDDSVVVKQKKQLDNLQEKREQFKMMYEWRKGLDGLTSEAAHMITEYIESKVEPFVLSKSAKKNLEKTINKYDFDDILNAINISESTYLRYEVDDTLEPDSVKNFFSKITGILVNSSRSPLELKISRIKGIGRKQFDNWEPQKGAIVLSKMLKKMRSYPGSSDESILAVLENTIEPMTQDAKSWRQWKWMMEEFLEALEDQQTNNATFSALHEKIGNQEYDLSLQNEVTVNNCIQMTQWVFPALSAVGSRITFEKKLTYWRLCSGVLNYLSSLNEYYDERLLSERDGFPSLVDEYIPTGLIKPDRTSPAKDVGNPIQTFYQLLGYFVFEVEDIVSRDKKIITAEEFESMAHYFHSQIEWPFENKYISEPYSVPLSQVWPAFFQNDEKYGNDGESFFQYVMNLLNSLDKAVPALIDMFEPYEGFQNDFFREKLLWGIVNYLESLGVSFKTPDEKRSYESQRGGPPSVGLELNLIGIGHMSFQGERREFYSTLIEAFFPKFTVFWGEIEFRLKDAEIMVESFYTIIDDKDLRGLEDLFTSIGYYKEQEKNNNIIPFPSKD